MVASEKRNMTANCLLVSANRMVSPFPVYPIGIAHIMGTLHKHGHRTEHIDILASEGYTLLEQHLTKTSFDIVGISIRNIDNVDSASPQGMLDDIAKVIEYVRKHSKAPVVLGGPGFSIMPEQILNYLKADYGIIGEGEEAFPELIDRIMSGDEFEERLFTKSLKDYPECQPLYSSNVAPYYIDRGGMLNVQTKRGCRYGCSYCSYPTIEGKKLRYRDPLKVVEEIRCLTEKFGARYIFFTDGVFNDPDDHYLLIAEELVRAGNKTPWCAFFRPQNLDREGIRLLKKSGMTAIELGTDASTDTTLAALNKGFTFEQAVAVNALIVAESLPCAHYIMFGGPDETSQTVQQGIANIERLQKSVVFAYIGIRILPGTKLYKRAFKEKVVSAETDLIQPLFYYSPMVERDFIDKQLRQAFQGRKDRVYPMADTEKLIPFLHSMGHDGPLWDLLRERRLKQ